MTFDKAKSLIDTMLGTALVDILLEGLPGGRNEQWGYDEQLVIDLGKAIEKWRKRDAAK